MLPEDNWTSYAAKRPASPKARILIGGSIARRSEPVFASRMRRQRSRSLSFVTISVLLAETCSHGRYYKPAPLRQLRWQFSANPAPVPGGPHLVQSMGAERFGAAADSRTL